MSAYLITKRLIIRPVDLIDAKDFFEYAPSPLVGPFAGWEPHHTLMETKSVIKNMMIYNTKVLVGHFVIIEKSLNKMIGTIELYNYIPNFKAELGYALNPKYWNQGYVTEAAKRILEYGFFELKLKRIEAATFVNNYGSIRVCEKIGMTFEGLAKNAYLRYDGKIFDEYRYGITDQEFKDILRKEYQLEEESNN